MKRTVCRTLALLLTGAALCAATALPAAALWDLTPSGSAVVRLAPALTVTGGTQGTHYTYDTDTNTLTILKGNLTVTSTGTGPVDASILVANNYVGDLTLDNVQLCCTTGPALTLTQGTTGPTLCLEGENTLQGADGYAGIFVPSGTRLTLSGSGTLTARGGEGGAGIGGNAQDPATATPADNAANPGYISVLRGTVIARGGEGAQDIGGGSNSTYPGTFTTGQEGNGIVYADTIGDKDDTSGWSGLFVNSTEATLYGNVTLDHDLTLTVPLTLPQGTALTTSAGLTCPTITNQGNLTLAEGATLTGAELTNGGTLENQGTVTLSGGTLTNEAGATLTNLGTVTLTQTTLTNEGTLDNQGTLTHTGGTLDNGTAASLSNSGLLTLSQTEFNNAGALETPGTMALAESLFTNEGRCTVPDAGWLSVCGSDTDLTPWLVNQGDLTLDGTLELKDALLTDETAGQLTGSGTFLLTGAGAVTGGVPQGFATEYRIILDPNGGTATPESAQTEEGKLPELPTPTREGYLFDGWFTQAEGGTLVTEDTVFTAPATLYAQWHLAPTPTPTATPTPTPTATPTPSPTATPAPTATPKPTATPAPTPQPTAAPTPSPTPQATPLEMHTLHFNTMGGLPLADVQFGLGAPVELWPYTPVRAGYLFAGWYADEALTQPVSTIVLTKDTTLYAKWNVDPATVAAAQSGSGSGTGNKGSGTVKATATPKPTATPSPTPTAAPTAEPTQRPIPTVPPNEEDQQGGFPILPVAGGVAALAAVAGIVVAVRRKSRNDRHYHHR